MIYRKNSARPFLTVEDLDASKSYVIVNFEEQGQVIFDYLRQHQIAIEGVVSPYWPGALTDGQIKEMSASVGFIITRSSVGPTFGESLVRLRNLGVAELLDPEWFFAVRRQGTDYFHIFKWAERLTDKSGVVVDIGANKGFTSLALEAYGSSVVAFEPGPPVFEELCDNTARRANVYCENLACSDKAGTADFYLDLAEGSYGSSLLSDFQSRDGFTPVQVHTIELDAYCQKNNLIPSFVKIDVEGHEHSVIAGMHQLIERYQMPIVFEFWHSGWNTQNKEMFDYLANYYQLLDCEYEFDAREYFEVRGAWLAQNGANGSSNIVCIPKREAVA